MPKNSRLPNCVRLKLRGGSASGGVFRGMLTLALGSGIGKLIGVAAIPVLTRLYTPEDFGVLTVFSALVAILVPLVTLQYVLALPLPRHNGVAINLLSLSFLLILGLTSVLTVAFWSLGTPLLMAFSMEMLVPWWWLIVLGVLATACYEMLTMWATRRRAYKIIAQTSVAQSTAGALLKISLGLAGYQSAGLLAGQIVAQAGGTIALLRGFLGEIKLNCRRISLGRMQKVAWGYRGFPLWRVPSQLLMIFSMQAPMLFIAAQYDARTTGQFGVAMMALAIPINLLGQSAGKALYGEASAIIKERPNDVAFMAIEVQKRLFLTAIIPALCLYFFGEMVFVAFLGEEWQKAGSFASVLSIAMTFQFASAPLVQLANLLAKQGAFFLISSLRVLGLVLVFWFSSVKSLQVDLTVIVYSLFMAFFYVGVSVFILRSLGLSVNSKKG